MTHALTITKTPNTRLLYLPPALGNSSISLKQSVLPSSSPTDKHQGIHGTKMQANYMLAENPLSLERIRSILTRLEDTIIFSLIERAQFAHNPKIYQKGAFPDISDLGGKSLFEWFLKETESFHGQYRITTSPNKKKSDHHVLFCICAEVLYINEVEPSPPSYPAFTQPPKPRCSLHAPVLTLTNADYSFFLLSQPAPGATLGKQSNVPADIPFPLHPRNHIQLTN